MATLVVQASPEDSLLHLLKTEKSLEKRITLYNELANLKWNQDYKAGRVYADSAYKLAVRSNNKEQILQAIINRAISEFGFGNFNEAEKWYAKAQKEAVILKNTEKLIYISLLKGNMYNILGNYGLALQIADSLELHLKKIPSSLASNYTVKARAYFEQGNLDQANKNILEAIRIRDSLGVSDKQPNALLILSDIYKAQIKFDLAEKTCLRLIKLAKANNLFLTELLAYQITGEIKLAKGEFDSAYYYFNKSYNGYASIGQPYGQAEELIKLASFYNEIDDYVNAVEKLYQALKLAEKYDIQPLKAECLYLLGSTYRDQKQFAQAIRFLKQSLILYQKMGHRLGESNCLNSIGICQYVTEKYDSAVINLKSAYQIRREIKDLVGMSSSLYNLAKVFENQGNLKNAYEFYNRSLEIRKDLNNPVKMGLIYNSLGSISIKNKHWEEALGYLKNAETINERNNNYEDLIETYQLLSDWYEKQNQTSKALEYYKKFKATSDTLLDQNKLRQINEIQARIDILQKDKEISVLNVQNEANQKSIELQKDVISRQTNTVILAVVVILLLAGLSIQFYLSYQAKERANNQLRELNLEVTEQKEEIQAQSEELREANHQVMALMNVLEDAVKERTRELEQAYKELDTFFYRASHDFRRPITTFLGLAEVANITVKDTNALELFSKVKETATNLDRMILKLQSVSDVGSKELEVGEIDFKEILADLGELYKQTFKESNIHFGIQIDLEIPVLATHPLMVSIILKLLIENAIDFKTNVNPKIECSVSSHLNGVSITVSDNGLGIGAEYQDKVFDMYFRASETSKGNGLGLYIVKRAVTRLKGSVHLKSEKGVGTTIQVYIPNMV